MLVPHTRGLKTDPSLFSTIYLFSPSSLSLLYSLSPTPPPSLSFLSAPFIPTSHSAIENIYHYKSKICTVNNWSKIMHMYIVYKHCTVQYESEHTNSMFKHTQHTCSSHIILCNCTDTNTHTHTHTHTHTKQALTYMYPHKHTRTSIDTTISTVVHLSHRHKHRRDHHFTNSSHIPSTILHKQYIIRHLQKTICVCVSLRY